MTPPPINIDGTNENYSNVTIDGQDVEQITIDGQDVLSAIPDSVVAQYDARNISASDGDSITTFPSTTGNVDASGSGTYLASDINGNPAVDFNRSNNDDFRAQFSSSVSQRVVVFIVSKTDVTTASNLHSVLSPHSTRSQISDPTGNGNSDFSIDAGSNGSTSSGGVDTNPSLLTAVFDGANTRLDENGSTVIGPQNIGSASWDGVSIGFAQFIGSSTHYDGSVGFIELHDGDPSSGLPTREQKIANGWGITL